MNERYISFTKNSTHEYATDLSKYGYNNSITNISPGLVISCLILISFSLLTVLGNCLVIVAVIKERCLRTVTNYFIVSLAVADLLMGSVVMPFAISQELLQGSWIYGTLWCDIWHAIDVWSSTCSILNLCAIAVERYYATHNPILHAARVSSCRIIATIFGLWGFSAVISFPAIFWWRALLQNPRKISECNFTTDSTYLVLSSVISFYTPLIIMIFVYYKIYKIAAATLTSLRTGCRIVTEKSELGENSIVLNVHRGGVYESKSSRSPSVVLPLEGHCSQVLVNDQLNLRNTPIGHLSPYAHSRKTRGDLARSDTENCPSSSQSRSSITSPIKGFTNRLHSIMYGKKSRKFAREQKAAKTLGIVMGIFVLCWLPFFICNVIVAVDNKLIPMETYHCQVAMSVVIWLGYVNSSINPIIYAHSMRDFRTAFVKILCCLEIRKWWQQNQEFRNYRKPSVITSDIRKSRSLLEFQGANGSFLELRYRDEEHIV